MAEAINGIIATPKKGTDIAEYRTKTASSSKDVASIDFNGDGKLNYGKKEGDTIKIFDWDNKTATGYHLVKKGELGMYGGTPAGQVDKTTMPLGRSLLKTFKGLSQEAISKICPNATLKDGQTFGQGATIEFKSKDGTQHNVHYVKDGEIPATTQAKTGAKTSADIKTDNGIFAGSLAWATVPAEK